MEQKDFTFTIITDRTPGDVFKAISNVRSWWFGLFSEEITGSSEKLHDEFSFRAGEGAHYSKQKLVEVIPDKRIVWQVEESALTFIEDQSEWTGTKMVFDIAEKDGKTELIFTHQGLTPEVACYNACAPTWSKYLEEKLIPLIQDGK
ncbi:SRPBCC domain-containing protein [Fluviicola sp.]|uniref:SRPBCC family protein n=1 Tax=Fluviicola sp. TaxID=1917219 RepID=UPI002601B6E9|nr:SRPBCC domain-containing protein [Fluviicola sp.]